MLSKSITAALDVKPAATAGNGEKRHRLHRSVPQKNTARVGNHILGQIVDPLEYVINTAWQRCNIAPGNRRIVPVPFCLIIGNQKAFVPAGQKPADEREYG